MSTCCGSGRSRTRRRRCRRASSRPPEKRRTGPTTTPTWARRDPGPVPAVRSARGGAAAVGGRRSPSRAARRSTGWPTSPTTTGPARHLRRQPPQPPRLRAACSPSLPEPWRHKVFVARRPTTSSATGSPAPFRARAQRHPHRADQGQPPLGRPGRRAHRRRLEPGDLPRGRPLAPTAGASRSRAVPPGCRCAAACRWCRSTSPAPAASSPRARSARRPAAPSSPSARPLWPADGEDSRRFAVRIERRSPPWPTRPPPTGTRPAVGRPRRDSAAHRARRRLVAPGLGPGRPRRDRLSRQRRRPRWPELD